MNALSAEVTAEIIAAYWEDPILAARQLLPHWFPRPMPWLHRGLVAILLRRADFLLKFGEESWPEGTYRWTKKRLAKLVRCFTYPINPSDPQSARAPIFHVRYAEDGRTPVAIDMVLGTHFVGIIPRGFAKTTVINFCHIYKSLYNLTKFTVVISEAAQHAKDQLATIKRELSGNERIAALFGDLKPDRMSDESWGAEAFETTTGVKFAAKGRGAQIRGMNKFGDRPDCITLDDVEDTESVETDIQIDKTSTWYVSDVEQALSRGSDGCIYAIGTMLAPAALLPTLCKRNDYTSVVFGAIDPEGEPLWDDKAGMSMDALEAKRVAMASQGKLHRFYLEFMSSHREDAKLKFRREYIRYQTHVRADFAAVAIHVDPAISTKPNADFSAIAVVGITEKGHKHVLDMWMKQGAPMSEQAEVYFEMKMKWLCTHHSCESVAYQAALAQVIRELMFRKAKIFGPKAYFEVIDTWPAGRKDERVEGILQPIMQAGYLTFQQIWPELEVQFLDWPHAKKDGPDAIAGAVATLEPFAALTYEDSEALMASDLPPHDYEAPCAAGSGVVP